MDINVIAFPASRNLPPPLAATAADMTFTGQAATLKCSTYGSQGDPVNEGFGILNGVGKE